MAESLRAALGAGLTLALCGAILVMLETWRGAASDFLLIAPLGGTAFLVFAVPNSPLAQPWSAVMGNTVSAVMAIAVTGFGFAPELAAGLAVCLAMAAMAGLRAMHPPGAAVALATVLSTPGSRFRPSCSTRCCWSGWPSSMIGLALQQDRGLGASQFRMCRHERTGRQ